MACMIVIIGMLLIGIPTSLGFGIWDFIQPLGMSILDFFDFISNSVLMPIVAFLTCIFIGFVVKPDLVVEEVRLSSKFKREKLFRVMIKYVCANFYCCNSGQFRAEFAGDYNHLIERKRDAARIDSGRRPSV